MVCQRFTPNASCTQAAGNNFTFRYSADNKPTFRYSAGKTHCLSIHAEGHIGLQSLHKDNSKDQILTIPNVRHTVTMYSNLALSASQKSRLVCCDSLHAHKAYSFAVLDTVTWAEVEIVTHPWTPDQLYSKSCSALVTSAEVLQGSVKREAVQPNCSQDPPGLHHICLPFILTDWPAKCQFLQGGKQSDLSVQQAVHISY